MLVYVDLSQDKRHWTIGRGIPGQAQRDVLPGDTRPLGQLLYQDTHRAVAGGQLIKVLADKPSLDALPSTLLNLANLNNARFLHIRVEPESVELGGQHLDQHAAVGAKSARRKADDTAASAEKASASAESREVKHCVVCQRHGHMAQLCVMPNPKYGSVRFCPNCNTKAHDFGHCPVVQNADLNSRTFVVEAAKLLILARILKPQIRSSNWSFFDLLALGCDLNYLETPATEGPGWPWSNKFAKEVAAVKPGDPLLKGKVHPSESDHTRHKLGDLPNDPFYGGKHRYRSCRGVQVNDWWFVLIVVGLGRWGDFSAFAGRDKWLGIEFQA